MGRHEALVAACAAREAADAATAEATTHGVGLGLLLSQN